MATAHEDEGRDETHEHEQGQQGQQSGDGWAIVPFSVPARVPADDLMCGDEVTAAIDNGNEG